MSRLRHVATAVFTGRTVRYGAVVVLLLTALTTTASAHQEPNHRERRLDLVSSAQPTAANRSVTDHAYRVKRAWRPDLDLDAVATSSATCDGCHGTARTVQIVDARRARDVHADNVATAWSSCHRCGADVVSVQVVLTWRAPDLRVNNRALAVNADCDACTSEASAFQVVVATHRWVDLYRLRREILAWIDSPAGVGGGASPKSLAPRKSGSATPRAGTLSRERLSQLEQLTGARTGGRVLRGDADVRAGD